MVVEDELGHRGDPLTLCGATRNSQHSELSFADGDERVQAIKRQTESQTEGTPLAHPRAMPIATTAPSNEIASNDAPSPRPQVPAAAREKLADTEAKRNETEADDVSDDAYDLACTD
jgi:hypothetical protein